jgi:hypothetical protein
VHEQTVLSVKDLRFVTLLCKHCNTRLTIDLEAEFEPPRSRFPIASDCPRCGYAFDSVVPAAVQMLQKSYQALVSLGDTVTFAAAAPNSRS